MGEPSKEATWILVDVSRSMASDIADVTGAVLDIQKRANEGSSTQLVTIKGNALQVRKASAALEGQIGRLEPEELFDQVVDDGQAREHRRGQREDAHLASQDRCKAGSACVEGRTGGGRPTRGCPAI